MLSCEEWKEVIHRDYQEKFFLKTLTTIILSLAGLLILLIVAVYRKENLEVSGEIVFDYLNKGSLFILSLSLLSNMLRDTKNVSPINKKILGWLNGIAVIVGFCISLLYGASFFNEDYEIMLTNGKIIVSIICYIVTIMLILGFNFFNRTDEIKGAVTNNQEAELIQSSNSESVNNDKGLKL